MPLKVNNDMTLFIICKIDKMYPTLDIINDEMKSKTERSHENVPFNTYYLSNSL